MKTFEYLKNARLALILAAATMLPQNDGNQPDSVEPASVVIHPPPHRLSPKDWETARLNALAVAESPFNSQFDN